ncbi:hypothetical protein LAZ29_17250 [Cereibacter sphaeroides]|uniref:hypothetical protein n=1 Tax=Rhodobacterales TaxID=204455 RepID=UPI000BBE8C33|nr:MULTISPECIES: hypothetical protein [Paracoccaceae]MCE6952681.1 hypothetical protein [Cereibacter sphaeroides]
MEWLIWIGAAISLAGVGGLVWCIWLALAARRSNLPDAEMRQRLQHVVVLNLAALGISAIGLMCVVAGILFG